MFQFGDAKEAAVTIVANHIQNEFYMKCVAFSKFYTFSANENWVHQKHTRINCIDVSTSQHHYKFTWQKSTQNLEPSTDQSSSATESSWVKLAIPLKNCDPFYVIFFLRTNRAFPGSAFVVSSEYSQ